ncbi:hypothetical protein CONCODRAFT_10034 [Conidiobolus coronatus NRRL 28638]|uniref:Uncharacterized protein n=1 Tax=Conidiobolus coronatus (strain ATCC 28846 / CBS 209.66 / NRRL 28638) TaxID=796925 RepID=A0A137NYU4_CONC2|nr:hypothetical protein CONCODRAFT_10034 [Conidiobolus coronatus NRRL 28638]|eukprot:KXN67848.1 hypothetical protein CONCODRAFT_10034 [Conidiobolus coronatus NRRL 28638]
MDFPEVEELKTQVTWKMNLCVYLILGQIFQVLRTSPTPIEQNSPEITQTIDFTKYIYQPSSSQEANIIVYFNNKNNSNFEPEEPILKGCSNLMSIHFVSLLKALGFKTLTNIMNSAITLSGSRYWILYRYVYYNSAFKHIHSFSHCKARSFISVDPKTSSHRVMFQTFSLESLRMPQLQHKNQFIRRIWLRTPLYWWLRKYTII